jgi:glycosyltransferase involved in cell wall biosynthesis
MIDVVFLACNRLEFTKASYSALKANTDWSKARLIVYDDGSSDGTAEWLAAQGPVIHTRLGSPVAVMDHYLRTGATKYWAKIDNDIVVPPGWLDECQRVMDEHLELELLGIEAFCPLEGGPRSYRKSQFIGGIGLFRRSAWMDRPPMVANGRFGFTDWQTKNDLKTGWINPSLKVILLNKLHMAPWATLSDIYEANKWQRNLGRYTDADAPLYDWWLK